MLTASLCERSERLQAALSAERAAGGVDWTFTPPSGGYFIWLRLPDDIETDMLVVHARTAGVSVLGGRACWQGDAPVDELPRHVRLCFAFLAAEDLALGVSRLATAVRNLRAGRVTDGDQ
jgi:2-aminoadipate transaminase